MRQVALSRAEKEQLAAAFKSEGDLDARLKRFADAAREEYLRMMLGQKVFTRGQDMREYRLFLLIQHGAFDDGLLPDERVISALFQTTRTQSRGLLRAVMSKYQYDLRVAIQKTLVKCLQGAKQYGDEWNITIESDNIVDELNRALADINGNLEQISRARDTVTTYVISQASYVALSDKFLAAP